MTTLNARANQAWLEYAEANGFHPHSIERDTFEEGWEIGYKTAAREVSRQIEEEIRMYDMEWSANTWRSIAARIAREVGEASS